MNICYMGCVFIQGKIWYPKNYSEPDLKSGKISYILGMQQFFLNYDL